MTQSSYPKANKTTTNELCKQALEHYLKLSDEACHYNSLIPKAIEFYRRMHSGGHNVEEYYEYDDELVKVEALNPHSGDDNTPKHDDYDLYYRKKHHSSPTSTRNET